MRVAVFGAGGFIGCHLCGALASAGADVVAVSSRDAGVFDAHTGIAAEPAPVGALDAVVYLSQSPHYRDMPRHAHHLWGVNVVSAIRVAQWAKAAGARRFVHASTGNVYAPSFAPHAEGDELRRDDWYALSKTHAEELLRLLDAVNVTSIRLFGVYGPGQRRKLIPNLAATIASGREIVLHGAAADQAETGGFRLSLTHIDDVTRAIERLLERPGPAALNVAGPEAFSIRSIADALGRELGIEPRFTIHSESRRFDLVADTSLLTSFIGGTFTPFATGIKDTVRELQAAGAL